MKSVFITGASGTGKSTTHNGIAQYGFAPSPNHLSRPPRAGEVTGIDAHFVSRRVFEQNFSDGHYLEGTLAESEYAGVYYGSPRSWLNEIADGARPVSATPANVVVLSGLCNLLEKINRRQNLVWVNLVAPIEVRRERLIARGCDPAKLDARLHSGVSHGVRPDADLNLDTHELDVEQVVGLVMQNAITTDSCKKATASL